MLRLSGRFRVGSGKRREKRLSTKKTVQGYMNLQREIYPCPHSQGKWFMKGLTMQINVFDIHQRILRVYRSPIFLGVLYSRMTTKLWFLLFHQARVFFRK